MKVTITNGAETIIHVSGQLDTLTSADLEKEVIQILEGDALKIKFDGAELTYISSAGLRLLIILQKKMKAKRGTFSLINIRPEIMDILKITGFTAILTIE